MTQNFRSSEKDSSDQKGQVEMTQNFRSILLGIGVLNYPDTWWKPQINRLLLQLRLTELFPMSPWESWVVLGQQWSQIWELGVTDCGAVA